ncbi:MAG: hypothetical protein AAF561_11850 [Planctomycetota bacterium]
MLAALLISAAALLADAEPAESPFDRTIELRPALADGADAPHPLALAVPTYDRVQGDATPVLHQAFLSLPRTDGPHADPSFFEKVDLAFEQKPGDLDRELFREIVNRYESSIDLATLAARRSDFTIQTTVRERGIAALLPHLNPSRELTNAIHISANLAADEGRWDDWLSDVAAILRLSQHLGDHDEAVLVEGLVAAGVGGMALHTIEDADAVAGRPNLYWALSAVDFDLDLLRFMQAETLWVEATLPQLSDPSAMNAARFGALLDAMNGMEPLMDNDQNPLARMATNTAAAAFLLAQARPWLVEHGGFTEAVVDAMTPFEAVARHLKLSLDQSYAEIFRITLTPMPEAIAAAAAFESQFEDPTYGSVLVKLIVPSVTRARMSLVALERRQNGLIIVDALRDHLARHGELPASLDDVALPLPNDPMTGEPFVFERLDDASATLHAVRAPGTRDRDQWTWKLEVAGE